MAVCFQSTVVLFYTNLDVLPLFFFSDPDGDRVAFSSTEEMKDAIGFASEGVLRVYIKGKFFSPTYNSIVI